MIGAGQSIPGFHKVPSSVNAIVGGLTGTVADIQEWQDGNELIVAEVAGTPGIEVEILFTNVRSIRRVGVGMFYEGSTTHWIEIQLWDYVGLAWRTLWTFTVSNGTNYRYSDVPNHSTDFIDPTGNAKMRIYHPAAGNAAHDAHIDYATLIT